MTSPPAGFLHSLTGVPDLAAPTGPEASAFDRWAIEQRGVPQPVLMENAGRSAAQVLSRLFPAGPVVVVAGTGNNGGDGWVLARTLCAWGRSVQVLTVGSDPGHAALGHGWSIPSASSEAGGLGEALAGSEVVVDAVLGTGLRGAPREAQARAIEAITRSGRPVLALDVPSGVSATSGAAEGAVVSATATVAFGAPKLGTLLHPGRARSGRLIAVEIGFPPADARLGNARVLTPGWAAARRPRREPVTHKKAVGSLLVVAGREGMAGAALLCVRAALRAGIGLVRVASPASNREVLQRCVPEALYVDREDPRELAEAVRTSDAVVVGPGMGLDDLAVHALERVLAAASASPVVMDADALTLSAAGRAPGLGAWAGQGPAAATPHLGELGRLTGSALAEPERLDRARGLAAETGVVVLAKGAPSVVCEPKGALSIDVQGSSDLATAGMGDVLAGVAGAYAAQGVDLFTACGLALHDSGAAHRRAALGDSLTPSDLVERLPEVRSAPPGASDLALPFVLMDLPAPW
ncbi:MAG: NAD(P)H-hydrate dehydratase [Gemmatimonadota bacterium]